MDLGNVLFFPEFEIVFDRNKAILDKERHDKEKQKKKLSRIIGTFIGLTMFVVVTFLFECFLVTLFMGLMIGARNPFIIIALQALTMGGVPLIFWCFFFKNPVGHEITLYPANVKYHLATEGMTILEKKLYIGARIILSLEDRNHGVTEKSIYILDFDTITYAGIEKVTVDLDKQIIFLPCRNNPESD